MANFSDIILAIRDQLATVYTDENAVIVSARKRLPPLVGDKDIVIRIRSARDIEGTVNAAGRTAKWIRRYVDLTLRTRTYTDVTAHDLQWLTDDSVGILALEASVLDCFEMWQPQASTSVSETPYYLLLEPARIVALDEVTRDQQQDDPNWGSISLRLDLYYEQTLRQLKQLQ